MTISIYRYGGYSYAYINGGEHCSRHLVWALLIAWLRSGAQPVVYSDVPMVEPSPLKIKKVLKIKMKGFWK